MTNHYTSANPVPFVVAAILPIPKGPHSVLELRGFF
jgi:hypothetical protein